MSWAALALVDWCSSRNLLGYEQHHDTIATNACDGIVAFSCAGHTIQIDRIGHVFASVNGPGYLERLPDRNANHGWRV